MVKYIDQNEHRNAATYRHQEVNKWYEEGNRRYNAPIHANDPDLRRDKVKRKDDDFAMIDSGQVNHNNDHIPVDYYEKERDKWYEENEKRYTPINANDPDYYFRRDEKERDKWYKEDNERYTPIHVNDPDLRRDEVKRKDDDYYKTYMKNHFDMIESLSINHNNDHIPVCYENEIDKWYEKDYHY
jgi:hypothetical protein